MDLLDEIRAAWPSTPYPGDRVLFSDCWCDECAWAVRSLRGKSWKEIDVCDLGGDGGRMSDEAFRYYLPGVLALSVQHPDETHLSCEVNLRFVFSRREGWKRQQSVSMLARTLSPRQREVMLRYFDWLDDQRWQAPILIAAAKRAVHGEIEPYSADELDRWHRRRADELEAGR